MQQLKMQQRMAATEDGSIRGWHVPPLGTAGRQADAGTGRSDDGAATVPRRF